MATCINENCVEYICIVEKSSCKWSN